MAGVAEARNGLQEMAELMQSRFWEPTASLYADEATADWQLSRYRGQNANMHACEALLAAFDATGEGPFLERACSVAEAVTVGWPGRRTAWSGSTTASAATAPGKSTGNTTATGPATCSVPGVSRPAIWPSGPNCCCRSSAIAATRRPDSTVSVVRCACSTRRSRTAGMLSTAAWPTAFAGSLTAAPRDGSLHGVRRGQVPLVQAESIAAAARLALTHPDARHWQWYERIWAYAWQHFVDHRHGAWFVSLDPTTGALTTTRVLPARPITTRWARARRAGCARRRGCQRGPHCAP